MDKPEGQAGAHQTGEITISDAMIDAGVEVYEAWADSNEPDPAVMVRDLLSAALGARVTSSKR